MTMRTGKLGRTGLEVSIVGLGTAFLGIPDANLAAAAYDGSGDPIPAQDDLAVAAVHAALEGGCTLIDTAPLYCQTRSESCIGRALNERPELGSRCTVTTKVGQLFEGVDHTREAVLRHVEASQRRLRIDHFSALFIHDPMGVPMEQVMGDGGTLGALRQLQKDGVVDYVGVAANEPETNADYIETGEFDAAVVPEAWSLLNQWAERRILPAAEKHDVGLVMATPLERGLLATGPVEGRQYLARRYTPEILDHVAGIKALCAEYGVPMNAAALQWCCRHPQVAATIPGARVAQEASANAAAGAVEIPEAFWNALDPWVRHWDITAFNRDQQGS